MMRLWQSGLIMAELGENHQIPKSLGGPYKKEASGRSCGGQAEGKELIQRTTHAVDAPSLKIVQEKKKKDAIRTEERQCCVGPVKTHPLIYQVSWSVSVCRSA
jgi:hypothetical protein